jgi:hypothetical protein
MKVCHMAQRGAAMVEFIVVALFVLVPMYLAVQALGKFADVRSAANNAARYAAWEKTVWHEDTSSTFHAANHPNQKSIAQIRNEAMVRVFNGRQSGMKYASNDKAATTFAKGTDPLWRDTAGQALVDDPARFQLAAVDETPAKDVLGGAIGLINKIAVPHVTGGLAPPVPTKTLAVATLHLQRVGEKSEVYKRLWSQSAGLPTDFVGEDFVAQGAILSNTWAANSSQGTHEMVKGSVPTAGALGKFLGTAAVVTIAPWDLALAVPGKRVEIGKISPDVVPPDRLK